MSTPGATARWILRNRDLRRLLLAFLAFNAVEYATWIAILVFAYEATGSASVGLVALVQLVPAAITAPVAASVGDRYPRERVLLGGYLAYAAGMGATAAIMLVGAPAPVVYLVAAIGGAPLVVIRPTPSALIPSLSDVPEEVTSANGAGQIVEGAGILVGPLLAAAILSVASPTAIFVLGAFGILGGGWLIRGLRPTAPVHAAIDRPARAWATRPGLRLPAFAAGVRVVLADADARLVVGMMTARMVTIGAADVLFVLMALDLLGMGAPGAGVLNAAFGAGTLAGGAFSFVLAGRGRLASLAAIGALAWGLALGVTGVVPWAPGATVLLIGGGAGLALVDLAGRTILQRTVRDEVLATAFGVQEGLAMAGLGVGAIVAPAFVVVIGLPGAIVAIAAFAPLMAALAWTRLHSLDERAAAPVRAIEILRRGALFSPLPAPQLEAVARRSSWLDVPAGTMIIREGDLGDRYYVLASGAVRVARNGRYLRDLTSVGDGFGEIALLRDVPRTATVTAIEPTTLLVIGRAAFLGAVTGNRMMAAEADHRVRAAAM